MHLQPSSACEFDCDLTLALRPAQGAKTNFFDSLYLLILRNLWKARESPDHPAQRLARYFLKAVVRVS